MPATDHKPIRVLAADDSAVMRGILRTLFSAHDQNQPAGAPPLQLCGVVQDGVDCLTAVLELRPDVVVLDLEMPRMHGLEVLARLRSDEPGLPVIMCSAYTECGARSTLEALALGAADYVTKPAEQSDFATALETLANQLMPKIAALAGARRERLPHHRSRSERPQARPAQGSDEPPAAIARQTPICPWVPVEIVVIGVSTGGPAALETLLPELAADFPVPIMVVQHMPKLFTGALAERLDRACALHVREAFHGAPLVPGTIWLAPGDAHMEIREPEGWVRTPSRRNARAASIRLHQQPSLNHCKPSADYLFSSAARVYGAGALALVMTGMGSDGLAGARYVHETCGIVLIQDEATSAVWGMPGRVFEAGISCQPMPLGALAGELTRRATARRPGPVPEAHLALDIQNASMANSPPQNSGTR